MICPRCQAELSVVRAAGNEGLLCPKCDGIWLPKGCLMDLARVPPEVLRESPLASTLVPEHPEISRQESLICPLCRATMKRYLYCSDSGVTVDCCPDHGLWLDDGELNELLDYIRRSEDDTDFRLLPPRHRSFLRVITDWLVGSRR